MKLVRATLALAVAFVLVALVDAGPGDQEKKKEKKGKGTVGVIEKVEVSAKTFTIKTGRKKDPNATTETFTFTDDTKFSLRGENGELDANASDLASGKRVMVMKETKDGKEVVSRIVIVEGKKKP